MTSAKDVFPDALLSKVRSLEAAIDSQHDCLAETSAELKMIEQEIEKSQREYGLSTARTASISDKIQENLQKMRKLDSELSSRRAGMVALTQQQQIRTLKAELTTYTQKVELQTKLKESHMAHFKAKADTQLHFVNSRPNFIALQQLKEKRGILLGEECSRKDYLQKLMKPNNIEKDKDMCPTSILENHSPRSCTELREPQRVDPISVLLDFAKYGQENLRLARVHHQMISAQCITEKFNKVIEKCDLLEEAGDEVEKKKLLAAEKLKKEISSEVEPLVAQKSTAPQGGESMAELIDMQIQQSLATDDDSVVMKKNTVVEDQMEHSPSSHEYLGEKEVTSGEERCVSYEQPSPILSEAVSINDETTFDIRHDVTPIVNGFEIELEGGDKNATTPATSQLNESINVLPLSRDPDTSYDKYINSNDTQSSQNKFGNSDGHSIESEDGREMDSPLFGSANNSNDAETGQIQPSVLASEKAITNVLVAEANDPLASVRRKSPINKLASGTLSSSGRELNTNTIEVNDALPPIEVDPLKPTSNELTADFELSCLGDMFKMFDCDDETDSFYTARSMYAVDKTSTANEGTEASGDTVSSPTQVVKDEDTVTALNSRFSLGASVFTPFHPPNKP
eukprot:CFRG2666T1